MRGAGSKGGGRVQRPRGGRDGGGLAGRRGAWARGRRATAGGRGAWARGRGAMTGGKGAWARGRGAMTGGRGAWARGQGFGLSWRSLGFDLQVECTPRPTVRLAAAAAANGDSVGSTRGGGASGRMRRLQFERAARPAVRSELTGRGSWRWTRRTRRSCLRSAQQQLMLVLLRRRPFLDPHARRSPHFLRVGDPRRLTRIPTPRVLLLLVLLFVPLVVVRAAHPPRPEARVVLTVAAARALRQRQKTVAATAALLRRFPEVFWLRRLLLPRGLPHELLHTPSRHRAHAWALCTRAAHPKPRQARPFPRVAVPVYLALLPRRDHQGGRWVRLAVGSVRQWTPPLRGRGGRANLLMPRALRAGEPQVLLLRYLRPGVPVAVQIKELLVGRVQVAGMRGTLVRYQRRDFNVRGCLCGRRCSAEWCYACVRGSRARRGAGRRRNEGRTRGTGNSVKRRRSGAW